MLKDWILSSTLYTLTMKITGTENHRAEFQRYGFYDSNDVILKGVYCR